jgi:hypothetical protein
VFAEDSPDWVFGEGLDILARTGDVPRHIRRDGKRTVEARYRDAFGAADGPATWQRLFLTGRRRRRWASC